MPSYPLTLTRSPFGPCGRSITAYAAVLDYDYDAVGQLTRQRDEQGQRYLSYDVTGKVTGVYRDAAHSQPLVVFTYDERGFRASKASYDPATYQLQQTTYSVRDAAGNELSTYVQDAATPGSGLQRSEVPLYGASRIGALTRLDDGSLDYRYELNDQLGTARVIYHRPTTSTYTATLEPGAASQEEHDFTNVATTRFTAPGHGGSASVARLGFTSGQDTGPGKILAVQRGDTVTLTAYAWLTAALSNVRNAPTTAAARLVPVVGLGAAPAVGPASPPTEAGPRTSGSTPLAGLRVGAALTLGGGQLPQPGSTASLSSTVAGNAQLHYLIRDQQGHLVQEDYQEADAKAPGRWQQLQVGLRLAQAGTVELRVETNGAGGPDVYFDDVQVVYTSSTIVQEQHTYAYGAPLRGLNYVIGSKSYRHGFQGQFAEIDPETGTEDFELRNYDSRIGRWTAPDPAGQYASPYVGLGNNPVSSVDPDGGVAEWLGSFLSGIGIGHLVESAGVAATYYGPSLAQIGSVSLQVGLGAAATAVQAGQGPGQEPSQSGTKQESKPIEDKSNKAQVGLDYSNLWLHFVGPTLIGLGQPLNFLKPVGALGSASGSSIASSALSKALPFRSSILKKTTRVVVAKVVGEQIARRVGTAVVGRFLGRFVPYAGWALTAHDIYENREYIQSFIETNREINEKHANDLM